MRSGRGVKEEDTSSGNHGVTPAPFPHTHQRHSARPFPHGRLCCISPIIGTVYELTVQTEFCAAHAIWIRGVREPTHGHNWRVSVVVSGDRLDEDGLLCDFHEVERALAETIAQWRDRSLNDAVPFAPDGRGLNPTAEHVARQIALGLDALMAQRPDGRGTVSRVSVTEAPGCIATYFAASASSEQRGIDR